MADAVGGGGEGGAPAAAPSGGASAPATGAGAAPAPAAERAPVLYRPKDADREFDVSEAVENALKSHKRKVVIDGNEHEVDIETAFRAASLEPASRRLVDQAGKMKKEAQAQIAHVRAVNEGMNDPALAKVIQRKRWGDEKYEEHILSEAREIIHLEKLKKEAPQEYQRQVTQRKLAADTEERRAKVAADEHRIKLRDEETAKTQQQQEVARRKREWPPLIKSHGIPEGFMDDVVRGTVAHMREAGKLGIKLTEKEAISRAAADIKRKLGPLGAAPPPPTPEVVAKQPGRESPNPPPPREPDGKFQRKNGVLRPDDLRARLDALKNG